MKEQEKADISKRFIEALIQVPVVTCLTQREEVQLKLQDFFPRFMTDSFPFPITAQMLASMEPRTLYHVTDITGCNYNIFLYDHGSSIFIAGPYLTASVTASSCEQLLQKCGKTQSLLMPLQQFCLTLPVIENSRMLEAVRTALKVVTGVEIEIPYFHFQPQQSSAEVSHLSPEGVDEAAMELLEKRYRYEKLLLQEVAQGNQETALYYYRRFSLDSRGIIRTEDPLRTRKNLSFSLNTMLRKSAETAGIHPIYLDIISSNFAMLIENSGNLKELEEFSYQMISAYCRFVRKNSLGQYSPLIRKAITYIRLHLADHLSLDVIARGIRVSPSYLSRLFNQEVKESISNYITRVRIEKAAELLSFTHTPIQTVASYVGFADLNYFSRCFKKYMNITPTQFRDSAIIH